ncbi:MAG: hypothetical protein ACRDJO_09845 [Actinomycetota bacterium]
MTKGQVAVMDLKQAMGSRSGGHAVGLPVRQLVAFIAVALAGLVAVASGLLWDAALHAADRALAAAEGPFTLHNPGHLLFAIGVFLLSAGLAGLVTAVARAVIAASGRP